MRALRTFAVNMGYKYTSKEAIMSRITQKTGVIHTYNMTACGEEYIHESARTFGEGFKEPLKVLPLFMNIPTPRAMILVWKFQYSGKGIRTSL